MARAARRVETIGEAVDVFLARRDLAASSHRSYGQTLNRLAAVLGRERTLASLKAATVDAVLADAWGACAPATWNRHLATTRWFVAFTRRRGWIDELSVGAERRREPADRTRAIDYGQLERLWLREDVAVREKALWRLLYETAARASEVLSLDVEDLDLENRRAIVHRKGGDLELLHFQTGSARLLPRLIGGRDRGPLFLTDRRAAPGRDRRRSTSARRPAVPGCPTGARRSSSWRPRVGGRCFSSGIRRSHT